MSNHKEILRRTVEALEKSLRRYPENDKILQQLAVAYSQLGRYDPEAVRVYQRAAKRFASDAKIQRAVSTAYLVTQTQGMIEDIEDIGHLDQTSLARNVERLSGLSQEFPDSAYIHRALANLLMLRSDFRTAIHHYRCAMALGLAELEELCIFFETVRKLISVPPGFGVFFAELYERLGRYEQAGALFQDLVRGPRPDRLALDKYGEFLRRRIDEYGHRDPVQGASYIRQYTGVLLAKGNFAEALTWAQQLTPGQLAQDPGLARKLARRLINMEDFRQAFEYLSKVPLDAETKALLNEMAMLLEKRGELDTAVYILQYINDNDEYSREARQARAAAAAAAAAGKQATPDKKIDINLEIEMEIQMAERHWKNRRWEKALESYLRVLELGLEDYRVIIEPLDLVLERMGDISETHLVFLANYFARQKDWRRTLTYAIKALKRDPSNDEMSARLLQACDRLLTENPLDCEVRLLHGDEHLRIGHVEKAISEYRKAADVPESKMKATRRLARAHYKAGDLSSSLTRFRELPVLEVEDLEKLYDLAIAFAAQEQYQEAFDTARMIKEYDAAFRDVEIKCVEYEEKMNQNNLGFVLDPKMRELIGDHSIGRYKYVGKIGSGGMGVVHKVIDLKSNHVVAMKILREGLSSSGKAIDRFFREARIAATLHHKNIVNILDYNISNNYGQSYIAMEFVDGPSLRDLVEKKYANTVEIGMEDVFQALVWISQLCDALDATHKKGIIHRDIKPDNVMVAPGDVVKITDFGIVHIEEATFTPTGALIGTPRYMSPEQVHGGRIDARSDIYAVGIILYELLIGSPPFISGDISYQQVNVLPTPPAEICPAIPAVVDRIIMKCLEKAPADRYQSSMELKADIDEAYVRLGGDPARVRPDPHSNVTSGERLPRSPGPVDSVVELPRATHWHAQAKAQAARRQESINDTVATDAGPQIPRAARSITPGGLNSDLDDLDMGSSGEMDFDFPSGEVQLEPACRSAAQGGGTSEMDMDPASGEVELEHREATPDFGKRTVELDTDFDD